MRSRHLLNVVCALCLAGMAVSAAPNSPLVDAAMRQDAEAVRALLRDGADVNAAHGDGMTALHWAVRHGDEEMAALLIAAGADVTATTRLGAHTPLHVAGTTGNADVVEILLKAGADPNAATTTGASPLHFAAQAGSGRAVALLLAHGADANAREPEWGQTPLMFAAAAGRVEAIGALLRNGADPAIAGKVVDVAARYRADSADSRQRNARIAAIRKSLVRGESPPAPAPVSEPRSERPAPEPAPVRTAEEQATLVDLQEEPEPLGYADLVGTHGGLTGLLLASREGHAAAAAALLDGGAAIDQVSAADATSPLLIATINGHFDLAKILLDRGADPTLASDAGATPLYAALNMHWAPKSRHPQPTDYMQQEIGYLELMEAFLDAGADPNARLRKSLWFTTYNRDLLGVDRTGATPFWRAAYALDIPAMRLLLARGADPHLPTIKVPERFEDAPDESGSDASGLPSIPFGGPAVYPIHAASGVGYGLGFAGNSHRHVPDGWLPAMKFLVEELGADVNARDHRGYTPVHHAASRGDNELILYLVSKGADVTLVSRSGQTTVDLANGPVQRVQPFPRTVALLERLGAKNSHRCVSC